MIERRVPHRGPVTGSDAVRFTPYPYQEKPAVASDTPRRRPRSRPGDLALVLLLLGALALGGSLVHGVLSQTGVPQQLQVSQQIVRELGLSGLALFTEARYTRHPGLADRHAPFQSHPMALEHFPCGSLVPPPRHLHD
jgi:hypothetical protein